MIKIFSGIQNNSFFNSQTALLKKPAISNKIGFGKSNEPDSFEQMAFPIDFTSPEEIDEFNDNDVVPQDDLIKNASDEESIIDISLPEEDLKSIEKSENLYLDDMHPLDYLKKDLRAIPQYSSKKTTEKFIQMEKEAEPINLALRFIEEKAQEVGLGDDFKETMKKVRGKYKVSEGANDTRKKRSLVLPYEAKGAVIDMYAKKIIEHVNKTFRADETASAQGIIQQVEEQSLNSALALKKIKEIKKEIVIGNLNVISTCLKNFKVLNTHKSDLFQEGYQGLCGAVDRFDVTKGNKFETYAKSCIHKTMVTTVGSICKPLIGSQGMRNIVDKMKNLEAKTLAQHNRLPSLEEYRQYLGIKSSDLAAKYLEIKDNLANPVFLDRHIGDGEDTLATLVLRSKPSGSPVEIYEKKETIEVVQELLRPLLNRPKYLEYINLLLGLTGGDELQQSDLVNKLKVTKQAISLRNQAVFKVLQENPDLKKQLLAMVKMK